MATSLVSKGLWLLSALYQWTK